MSPKIRGWSDGGRRFQGPSFFKLCKLKKRKENLVMEEAGFLSSCDVNTFDTNSEGAITTKPADSTRSVNPARKHAECSLQVV